MPWSSPQRYSPSTNETARKTEIKRRQRDEGHDESDEDDSALHLSVDHPVVQAPRREFHQPGRGRIDTERQGRRGICEKIYPQHLRGEQGDSHGLARFVEADRPCTNNTQEHREHFAGVR